MLNVSVVASVAKDVNMTNINKETNTLLDSLFNNVNTTLLGTKLGELLAQYKIENTNEAYCDVVDKLTKLYKSDSNEGIHGMKIYRDVIAKQSVGYYFLNGNNLPVQMGPMDIRNLCKDVMSLYKSVKNY